MKLTIPKVKFKKPQFNINAIKSIDYRTFFKKLLSGKALIVIILGAILLINIFSQRYFIRFDTTDAQIYSISDSTRNIISDLSDEITIEVYFSDNVPPNLTESMRNVLDLFEEYSKASNGKLQLDIKNPSDSDFEINASVRGIQRIQFSEYGEDKFSVATGYLGAAVVKGEQVEAIPVVTSVDNIEYETTSRILKLSKSQEVKIGFLTKPLKVEGEEQSVQSVLTNLSTIQEFLERQYKAEEIDLSAGKPIDPKEFPVVVLIAPQSALSERDQFELEQYLFKGGSLLVLEDLLKLQDSPILTKTASNLNDFLKNYGLEVETKVLLDVSYTPIISQMNQIAYPYWVLATSEGINHSIPALTNLEAATFLWSNPIVKQEKSGLKYTELINTTDSAWTEAGDTISIDFKEFIPSNTKKYTLAYLVEGEIESQFKGKDIPVLEDSSKTDERTKENQRLDKSENIRLIVIGDADFMADSFINANEQNPVLFLNLVDWLTNADDIASIRAKSVSTRPLNATDQDQKNIYKAFNSAAVPVLMAITGVIYLRRRKNRSALL